MCAQFVAHPNVQQLLASIWYESVPGFRRKNMLLQALEMMRIGAMFPLYSLAYIASPHSAAGRTLRKPFIKFLCHSASYFMFLCTRLLLSHALAMAQERSGSVVSVLYVAVLLILASQRIETAASVWGGGAPGGSATPVYRRGSGPSPVEWLILAWVSGQFSPGNYLQAPST